MKYLDGIIVVEGSNDASYLSSFIKCEIVILNGCEINNLDYLKEASKFKQVYILTDPDEVGRRLSKTIQNNIPNSIDICVDIKKCNHKNKHGIAECEKIEILTKLDKFLKNNEVLRENFISICDIWNINKKDKLMKDLKLGKCNTKKLVERLNTLQFSKERLNDYK